MHPFDTEVCIAGAGPAGITASLFLARQGIPSILADKDHFPRDKVCGDGLSGKVLNVLNMLDPDITKDLCGRPFSTPSWGVRFHSPNRNSVLLTFPADKQDHPPGIIVRRRDLDDYLLGLVRNNPLITLLEGTCLNHVKRENGHVLVGQEKERNLIRAKMLLVATGTDHRLLNELCIPKNKASSLGLGIRCYFENIRGLEENHAIEIHFLKEVLPWYFWIFPFKDNTANVGLALPLEIIQKRRIKLADLLPQVISNYPDLKDRFRDSAMTGKIEACMLPFYFGRKQIAGDNYLQLGDAASLIDPFTGEGVGNAMISGKLAAETTAQCIKEGNFDIKATTGYQLKIYRTLERELNLGLRLQNMAKSNFLINLVVDKASSRGRIRKHLTEMIYDINSKGKLGHGLFYLKLMLGI